MVAAVVVMPWAVAALSVLVAAAQLALVVLARTPARSGGPSSPTRGDPDREIRLSVHVPVHAEPPEVVLGALRALTAQRGAPWFEVIVLDNNTDDPALWHPVRDWCAGRPGFRFHRATGVRGAKAGALNLALAMTDPSATHVAVIDADYVATPDFLRVAAMALAQSGADFVQFPQAFRRPSPEAAGLAAELTDYFRRHARAADRAGAMLLTGTLSVIDRRALDAVGGWTARTATEDADMGVRLLRAGFRGRYVDRVVGHGLMAFDLDGLRLQRGRWSRGNARTLALAVLAEARAPRLAPGQRRAVAMQLTAWLNLAGPAVWLAAAGVVAVLAGAGAAGAVTLAGAGATLALAAWRDLGPLWRDRRGMRMRPRTLGVALATRLALMPTMAAGTVAGFAPAAQVFRLTPKRPGTVVTPRGRTGAVLAGAALAAVVAGMLGVAAAPALAAATVLGLGLALFGRASAVSRAAFADYATHHAAKGPAA